MVIKRVVLCILLCSRSQWLMYWTSESQQLWSVHEQCCYGATTWGRPWSWCLHCVGAAALLPAHDWVQRHHPPHPAHDDHYSGAAPHGGIMSKFFDYMPTTFYIILVWMCDQYEVLCCMHYAAHHAEALDQVLLPLPLSLHGQYSWLALLVLFPAAADAVLLFHHGGSYHLSQGWCWFISL